MITGMTFTAFIYLDFYILISYYYFSVWTPDDKNSPNVAHACRKIGTQRPGVQGSQLWRPGPPGSELIVGFISPLRKNPVVKKFSERYGTW
jgi:hypothetical protein